MAAIFATWAGSAGFRRLFHNMEYVPRLLERATRVIAALGAEPQALHAVAAAAVLPPATCTRLLKELVRLGWADQDGNRGGYRRGPRAYALAADAPYRPHLVEAWAPRMRELGRRWPAAGVVLVVLRPWGRHLLWECGAFNGGGAGRLRLIAEELWGGASGRLLLALMPPRERHRWIDHVGLPAPALWRGIATRRELLDALAGIRRERWCEVVQAKRGLWASATPIADGEGGHAALGAYLPLSAARDGLPADLLATART